MDWKKGAAQDREAPAMQLIIYAGDAKSKAMEAIHAAAEGDFAAAARNLRDSEGAMTEAHRRQTRIMAQCLDAPDGGLTMLMAHAQDHLMNAITTHDLAKAHTALLERVDKLERRLGLRDKGGAAL